MKKLFLTTAIAVYSMFGYTQTAYWSYGFENGSLTDAVGNDDLVQNGSALTTVNDRFSNTNDAVTLGGDRLVGGTTGSDSYSISFWINDVVNDANQRMVVNHYLNAYGYYIVLLNGNLRAYAKFGASVNNQPYTASSPANLTTSVNVADGNWHHVAFTAREFITNGFEYKYEYKLYIDAVLVNSDIRTVSMISGSNRQHHGLSGSHTFAVGNDATNSSAFNYENTIDDIVFYKEDLTAAEVTTIYNERLPMTIYVDKDATGANDGTSWADAFTSLKNATVFATLPGDEIWVADGTYTPDASSRTSSFRIFAGVSLYGGFNGTETALSQRDWRTNEVILSGDLSGNDNSNVDYSEATRSENSYRVVVIDGDNTLIDGVTVSGGHGNLPSNNNYDRGSAIRKENDVNIMDVKNCIIENNTANGFSGIMAEFSSSSTHTVNIENCIFRNNQSRYGSSIVVTALAGTGTAMVSNCLMTGNQAVNTSFAPGISGSAAFFDTRAGSTLTASLINCTVIDNVDSGTSANTELAPVAVRRYDGILNFTAVNCAFEGNSAAKSFGRLNSTNCPTSASLSNNRRPDTGVQFCTATSTNESSVGLNLGTDFRPVAGSSSIDAGDNSVAVGTEDIDGNDRILGGTIDIGAFEFDPSACNPIAQQPISAITMCSGESTTMEVTASEAGASYQWNYNGSPISGATSASFTIANTQAANAGNYTVDVTVGCGSSASQVAVLTVSSSPTITQQPTDQSACEGDNFTFSVAASGTGLTYEWQYNEDPTPVTGFNTDPSLMLTMNAFVQAGDWRVIVSNSAGCSTISDVVSAIGTPIPTFTQQPTDQLGCLGDDATFTASVTGATLTQWYKNNAPMAGELSPTLTLSNLVGSDVAAYKMIAANSCGFLYSDVAQLNIGSTTTITSQPQGAEQCENTTATFSVAVTGTNISYQWQLDGQDLTGQTTQNLLVNGLTQADEGDYTCVVTGGCGVETSDAATLIVKDPAVITTTVSDFAECEGEDVTFSVGATGDDLTYAWIDQSGYIAGETAATLELSNVQSADAGSYTVEVTGICGATVADAGDLTVNALPVPTITENMGMLETGVFDTYQWYIDGNIQNGETNASITVTISGDYTVEVTGNGCEGTSSPYNVMTVGIDEQSASIVAAYPNPFNDLVTLELADFAGQMEITVVDMTGRAVFTSMETASKIQLNLEHLSTGTYGLVVRGEDGKTAMSRLIKN